MANIPDIPHPLQRDGRSQTERGVKALAPPASVKEALSNGSAMVDEHSLADLLDFILRFARQVRFQPFNPGTNYRQTRLGSNGISNGKPGYSNEQDVEDLPVPSDWAVLFRQSPLFILAAISKTDTGAIREQFDEHAADAGRFEQFEGVHLLFDLCISLLFQIHQWGFTLKEETEEVNNGQLSDLNGNSSGQKKAPFRPFGDAIQDIISTNLADAARRLIGYSRAAQDVWGYQPYRTFCDLEKLKAWGITSKEFPQSNTTLTAVKGSQRTKIKHAVQQLSLIFSELFGGMLEIVSRAEAALHETIQSKNAHPPHLGLLIAFTQLLEKARTNPDDSTKSYLNAATQKHLDFFYKQVLQLKKKDADPDHAHLVFEPAKQLDAVKLDKNTAFLGGTDQNGIPIVFKLDDEVVVTKAQVADIRTLYLKKKYRQLSPETPSHDIVQGVYFAPVANSADGLGEAFPKDTLASWKTLGWDEGKLPVEGADNLLMKEFQPNAKARLGLMVASKVLHLGGGQRIIDFVFACKLQTPEFDDVIHALDLDNARLNEVLSHRYYEISEAEVGTLGFSVNALEFLSEGPFPIRYADPGDFVDHLHELIKKKYHPNYPYDKKGDDTNILKNQFKPAFRVWLSGEKEWIETTPTTLTLAGANGEYKLSVSLILEENIPPVTWYNPEIHGEKLDTHLPAARFDLVSGDFINEYKPSPLYHFFRYLQITEVKCDVTVCNFRNLVIQTDAGVQEAGKPFMPFGPIPKLGNRFYIGSEEVFRKKWNQFALQITWKDKPEPFNKHYDNYLMKGLDETTISVDVAARSQNSWKDLANKIVFSQDPLLSPCSVFDKPSIWVFDNTVSGTFNETVDSLSASPELAKDGYVQFALKGKTFLHELFAQVFARQATAQAMLADGKYVGGAIYKKADNTYHNYPTDGGVPKNSIVELPNEPYTPVIETLSIDYTASADKKDIKLYHLQPFEGTFSKENIDGNPTVLPKFEDEGTLFIGLKDLRPGENLDLLFQVAESTADPDLQPADVKWFYLSKNVWKALHKDIDILSDETEGFLRSGVIKIAVPPDINRENTILPDHLHWFKASAHQRAGAVSETIGVHTQAARATFAPEKESFTDRLATPLPAGTISKALVENADIKKINQPYPGFGGLPKEPEPDFYRRVSEHLRHKGRAITLFDYERLALEYFPEVFKVKCINHSLGLPEEARDFHMAPGHVIVAVIPDLSKLTFSDRFRPKATRSLLDKIEDFLKQRTSPFVRVRVLNPRYQPFRVTGSVRFVQGKSADFYKKQLQKDLDRFLAPWAFGEKDKIDFGGVVYKSVILKYIESLEYVDYVTNFLLLRKKETVATQPENQRNVPLNLKKESAIRQVLNPAITKRVKISGLSFSALEIESIFNRLSSTQLIARAKILEEDYVPVDEIPADTARSILVAEEHVFEALNDECCKPDGNVRNDDCMKGLGFETIREGKPCPEKAILFAPPAPPHS